MSAAEQRDELIRWIFNFPECETGWRGDEHEVCHQNLEVYRAEILRKAREMYAPAPEPQATPPEPMRTRA